MGIFESVAVIVMSLVVVAAVFKFESEKAAAAKVVKVDGSYGI